jgi:hypothetical protein
LLHSNFSFFDDLGLKAHLLFFRDSVRLRWILFRLKKNMLFTLCSLVKIWVIDDVLSPLFNSIFMENYNKKIENLGRLFSIITSLGWIKSFQIKFYQFSIMLFSNYWVQMKK